MPGLFLFISSIIALIIFIYLGLHFGWSALAIFLAVVGVFLILYSGDQRTAAIEKQIDEGLERLKAGGESIKLDFDNCEFKDSSFSHKIVDQSFSHGGISDEIVRTENSGQSLLTYHYSNAGQLEKFTQAFPVGSDALKFYVLNGDVTLYIDPFDRTRYFFDLKT